MAKRGGGNQVEMQISRDQVSAVLLGWYDRNRRDLPWRRTGDPYAIWVSEIMLQQTRVAVVVERYQRFMARFPTIRVLAEATEQEVLALWSGLGYYRRARMLRKAARYIVTERAGILPQTAAELRSLPGIGGYTSAAIASIAHGERVAVVDGNVERVLCRLAGWDASNGKDRAELRCKIEAMAARLVDPAMPGDFNQAMMELGATVCVPRNPQCLVCPLTQICKTRGEHKTAPRATTIMREVAYALCVREARDRSACRARANRGALDREILLEQRPPSVTVMPGLWELPAMIDANSTPECPHLLVRHTIMNVTYVVKIREMHENELPALTPSAGERHWVSLRDAANMALTGLARKVLRRAHLIAAPESDLAGAPTNFVATS